MSMTDADNPQFTKMTAIYLAGYGGAFFSELLPLAYWEAMKPLIFLHEAPDLFYLAKRRSRRPNRDGYEYVPASAALLEELAELVIKRRSLARKRADTRPLLPEPALRPQTGVGQDVELAVLNMRPGSDGVRDVIGDMHGILAGSPEPFIDPAYKYGFGGYWRVHGHGPTKFPRPGCAACAENERLKALANAERSRVRQPVGGQ